MSELNSHQETIDAIIRRIADLNEQSLTQLSQYISYLKWQEELWSSLLEEEISEHEGQADRPVWQFDFLEEFPNARRAATRNPDMLEIKVANATCGMVQQTALWQHPPVSGSGVCEYSVAVPDHIDSLRLRFAVGIRDGALMQGDNLCAFRIHVNGARVWSTTKQTNSWERYLIDVPALPGQEMIFQFVTDALGDNRWNWAAWAEPTLFGYGVAGRQGSRVAK